jgi:mannose-1-phosphate guanylyltransferase/mannose-6-phosphate isomerase
MKIYPVILAGGSGTRLWPLSREALPKQLLPLLSERTMLQETVLRAQGLDNWMPPLVICGNEHRFLVAEQLREIGITPLGIVLEPIGKNTAPAAAIAAQYLQKEDPDAMLLMLPADQAVDDVPAFHAAVQRAIAAATGGALVTFGIDPSSPETAYGYIRRGAALDGIADCFAVEQFVEKPDRATAEAFLASPNYCWNSGMFLFRASDYLQQLKQFRPAIVNSCDKAYRDAYRDLDFCRLDEVAFTMCPPESIGRAVMESTRKAVVVLSRIGWNEVSSWTALCDVQAADENGNILRGDVYTDAVSNSMIRSENRLVAVIGVENLIVVETKDAVLVAHKDHVQGVKQIVKDLKQRGRCEHLSHTTVYRPWGSYEGIDAGERFQVKRITVKPGGKLSLQMHHHRAEHWVVVSGTARVTCGDEVKLLAENESTYIPIGSAHRLENPGKLPLHLIEVQSGAYLGEDDIVRFEDIYRRNLPQR